jgi:hypothetical protein
MTPTPPFVHTGKIDEKELASVLTSLDFALDHGEANASTYELISPGHHKSLMYHFRLLIPLRPGDKALLGFNPQDIPQLRVIAIVWYGSYYQTGLVIEVLGRDAQDYIVQKTSELLRHFDHEVPIAVRTLHSRIYTD